MSTPAMAAEKSTSQRHFVIGGSALQLRGISKQDADTTFNDFLTDFYKKNNENWSLEIAMYPTAELMLQAFDKGEIDGYFGSPLDYLARKNMVCKVMTGLKFKFAPMKQRLLILTRADTGATKISDLKNKRLSMAPGQDLEVLFMNTILLRNKLPEMQTFFSDRIEAKSTNVALMDVFFGKSDVTVARENEYNTAVELNPQLAKNLIILDKSPAMLSALGVINNKRITEQEFMDFLASFNSIIQNKDGEKLLALMQIDSVNAVYSDEVSNVESLLDERASLRKEKREPLKKTALPNEAK